MIFIDYKDTRPIYEQIVDKFETLILQGALEPDTRVPSVRSLAIELSINPNTIQKAYTELERRGYLYTIKGRGNYVAYHQDLNKISKKKIFDKVDQIVEEAKVIGVSSYEIIDYLKERANA